MKYIIAHLGQEKAVPVLFPPFVAHKEIVEALRIEPTNILSAGFCRIDGEKVECAGFATSLGKGPNLRDAELISACIAHTNAEYPARPR